jgi:hypothetical protein
MTTDTSNQVQDNIAVDETDLAHLAGVFDAAGTLSIHIAKDDSYKNGYKFTAMARMNRPANNNDPVIGKLMAYCEDHGISYKLNEKESDRFASRSYEWICQKPDDLERFLRPLMPYLVTHYERAVLMLEEIIPRMQDGLHTEKAGFLDLMEYADAIRESYSRNKDLQYDKSYFENEWSVGE